MYGEHLKRQFNVETVKVFSVKRNAVELEIGMQLINILRFLAQMHSKSKTSDHTPQEMENSK